MKDCGLTPLNIQEDEGLATSWGEGKVASHHSTSLGMKEASLKPSVGDNGWRGNKTQAFFIQSFNTLTMEGVGSFK